MKENAPKAKIIKLSCTFEIICRTDFGRWATFLQIQTPVTIDSSQYHHYRGKSGHKLCTDLRAQNGISIVL